MLLLIGAANPLHSRIGHYYRKISRNMRDNIPVPVESTEVKYRMPRTGHPTGRMEVSLVVRDGGVHGWRRALVIQASTL